MIYVSHLSEAVVLAVQQLEGGWDDTRCGVTPWQAGDSARWWCSSWGQYVAAVWSCGRAATGGDGPASSSRLAPQLSQQPYTRGITAAAAQLLTLPRRPLPRRLLACAGASKLYIKSTPHIYVILSYKTFVPQVSSAPTQTHTHTNTNQ